MNREVEFVGRTFVGTLRRWVSEKVAWAEV